MPPRSPLAPATHPTLPPIAGVRVGAAEARIRYKNRTDLFMAVLDAGTTVAGCLTRSLTASAPVLWCKANLPGGSARAIVVNSGNSNAFTGKAGQGTVEATAAAAAKLAGCRPGEVFIASTGVIGEPIPPEVIPNALPALHGSLKPDAWAEIGRAHV